MKNTIITVAAVAIVGVGGWYILSGDFVSTRNQTATVISADQTVATVNGERIFGADFSALQAQIVAEQGLDLATLNKEEKNQLQTQTMDALISRVLLQQAVASATDINITESKIAAQMETIKGGFENEATFNEALSAQGITEETLRTQIGYELAVQAYFEQKLDLLSVDVTEKEVEALYEQLTAEQDGPSLEEAYDQVKSLAIQQKQQALAAELMAKLRAQADIEILI